MSDKKLGVDGQRFGLIVPMAYKRFNREANKEDMDKAHVLGEGIQNCRKTIESSTGTR